MNFKNLYLFFNFLAISGFCQLNYAFKISNEDSLLKNDNIKAKFYLIGEFHNQIGNIEIKASYLNCLNKQDVYPKYLVVEDGESYAFLANKFLETGDDFILNLIEISPEAKLYYKELRRYYLNLPDNKKFKFLGVDDERDSECTHYSLRMLLIKNKDSLNNFISDPEMNEVFNSFVLKKDPGTWAGKDLRNDLNELSICFNRNITLLEKKIEKSDFDELRNILAAYDLKKKRKHLFYTFESSKYKNEREYFMINNIYNQFSKDTNAVYLGQFGLYHLIPKKSEIILADI